LSKIAVFKYLYLYLIYASDKNTQGVGYGYGGFRDSVDMGILCGFPQVFLWVLDGYGH